MTSWPEAWAEIWEKSVEFCRRKKVDFRFLAGALWRVRTWFGADGNVSIERMCIFILMLKNLLNSKVNKSFVPELRSRKCFSCFGIPILFIYELWTFYVYFTYPYIWLCNKNSKWKLCGDSDKTINHFHNKQIISECYKLVLKKYKTRHDWLGKGIHLELCK